MKRLNIISILFLLPVLVMAQDGFVLREKFMSADSICIASHEDLTAYGNASDKWATTKREIFKNRKPNYDLVKEIATLNKGDMATIYTILTEGHPDEEDYSGYCIFNPHHAIFIYKDGMCYCISLCFQCRQYMFSEGLKSTEQVFVNFCTWKKLHDFFIAHGIKFKMQPTLRC